MLVNVYGVMMRPLASSLLLLTLAGCALGPDYTSHDLASLKTPADWQNMSASESSDLTRWWENFNDPVLNALVAEALQDNLDLKIAASRLRQARAQRTVTGAGSLPGISASGSASSGGSGSNTSDRYQAGFDASWEVDIWGQQRRSNEAADADVEAAIASSGNTRITLLAEVARIYTELRSSQLRLRIAEDNLRSQRETLGFIDLRNQAGLINGLTLDQARTSYAQTAAQIPSLQAGVSTGLYQLATLLGDAPGTLDAKLNAPAGLPKLPEQLTIGIPADVLRQRPDIQQAERNLAAETARIGVAEAAQYPSFGLSGSIGIDALSPSGLINAATRSQSVLGNLAMTIFDAGRLRAQLDIQTETQEQAFLTYQSTILTALQEVETTLVNLKRTKERVALLQRVVSSSRSANSLARNQYQAGLIDYQTLLETERSRLSSEDSLASAQADELTNFIALYKALGGGWNKGETNVR